MEAHPTLPELKAKGLQELKTGQTVLMELPQPDTPLLFLIQMECLLVIIGLNLKALLTAVAHKSFTITTISQ